MAADQLFGEAANDVLNGDIGADTMMGSVGNDAYIVDNADDGVVENAGEGDDTVFTSVNYGLTANVEILVMQGAAPACGASAIRAQFDLRHYPQ